MPPGVVLVGDWGDESRGLAGDVSSRGGAEVRIVGEGNPWDDSALSWSAGGTLARMIPGFEGVSRVSFVNGSSGMDMATQDQVR